MTLVILLIISIHGVPAIHGTTEVDSIEFYLNMKNINEYKIGRYYQDIFSNYGIRVNLIHRGTIDILKANEWDLSILRTEDSELPNYDVFQVNKTDPFNMVEVEESGVGLGGNMTSETFDKLINDIYELPLDYRKRIDGLNKIFSDSILYTVPIGQEPIYYTGDIEIINNTNIIFSLLRSLDDMDIFSMAVEELGIIPGIFDPLQYDVLPPGLQPIISTLMATDHGRILYSDIANNYTIENFQNVKFAELPLIIDDGKITFFLGDRIYSDGSPINPDDFVFTSQLLSSLGDEVMGRIVDYEIGEDSISFLFSSRKYLDDYYLSRLFPSPLYLNTTLTFADSSLELHALSGNPIIFNSILWNNFEKLQLGSGYYEIEDFFTIGEKSHINYTTHLPDKPGLISIHQMDKIEQKRNFLLGNLDYFSSYSPLDFRNNAREYFDFKGSYHLAFNLERFKELDRRLLFAKLLDRSVDYLRDQLSPLSTSFGFEDFGPAYDLEGAELLIMRFYAVTLDDLEYESVVTINDYRYIIGSGIFIVLISSFLIRKYPGKITSLLNRK